MIIKVVRGPELREGTDPFPRFLLDLLIKHHICMIWLRCQQSAGESVDFGKIHKQSNTMMNIRMQCLSLSCLSGTML